jgi:hypothetical protein
LVGLIDLVHWSVPLPGNAAIKPILMAHLLGQVLPNGGSGIGASRDLILFFLSRTESQFVGYFRQMWCVVV